MSGSDPEAGDGDVPAKPSTWQRLWHNPDNERIGDRLKDAMLKPVVNAEIGPDAKPEEPPSTLEELEGKVRRADDTERMVGLVAAPIAGLIAIIVTGSLIGNDPKATLANGLVNVKHVNPSLYLEVGGSAFVLAMLMLGLAWFRKRLFLGIVMGLYGLTLFNLHFWGFGIPFLFGAGWYLVRHYRLTQKVKLAKEGGGGTSPNRGSGPGRPNKRYTPPTGR
jgi:hypothetical protein